MKHLLIIILFIFTVSKAEKNLNQYVKDIDFDRAIIDICIANEIYCRVLTDKRINSYLRKYYKPALMSIAHIESNFKYKQGIYDKDDISYFQINKRVWNRKLLKKYNMNYPYWKIKHDLKVATIVALKIWLINISQYIIKTKKYPKSLPEYISLYHRVKKIDKYYKRKVRKVVYKYLK